jgi:hypothetical protein
MQCLACQQVSDVHLLVLNILGSLSNSALITKFNNKQHISHQPGTVLVTYH